MLIYYYFIYLNIYRECVRANSCSVLCNKMFSRIFESLPLKQTKLPYRLYRENAIAIESEARDPFCGNVYYVQSRAGVL